MDTPTFAQIPPQGGSQQQQRMMQQQQQSAPPMQQQQQPPHSGTSLPSSGNNNYSSKQISSAAWNLARKAHMDNKMLVTKTADMETEDGRISNREAAEKIKDAWMYKQIRARQDEFTHYRQVRRCSVLSIYNYCSYCCFWMRKVFFLFELSDDPLFSPSEHDLPILITH